MKEGVHFHPDFEWLCQVAGVKPKACRPYRPQTKGGVERLGRYIKENAVPWITINCSKIKNLNDLQNAFNLWIDKVADQRLINKKRISDLYEEEKAFLYFVAPNDLHIYANTMMTDSKAELCFFGYKTQLDPCFKNSTVCVFIRANGEYRISLLSGHEVETGCIPEKYLTLYKFNSPEQNLVESTIEDENNPLSAYKIY